MAQNSFVERVRNGEVKAPTQPSFSLNSWEKSHSSIEAPSLSDQRLYASGVWFAFKLGQVRDLLAKYEWIGIPEDRTVQAHVGGANWMIRNDTRLYKEQIDALKPHGGAEAEASEYSPGDHQVMQLHSLMEAFVTSLRFPLANAIRESHRAAQGEVSEGVEAITKIRIGIQAGTIYDLLYYLWNECLWNNWYVHTSLEADLVLPSNEELATARAVGERRWTELSAELFLRLGIDWRRRTHTERERLVSMRRAVGLVQEDGAQRITTGPGDPASSRAPIELLTELASTELYFGELLSEELPNFPGLCINHLTSAWAALAPLADIFYDRFPEHDYIDTLKKVLDYCPIFKHSQLEEVLTDSMRITSDQAKQILNLLTFSEVREELWLRPFVNVDEETVSILVHALKTPNLLRSIEEWMKVGGLDLDRRGGAFERFARERLAHSNQLTNFEIVRSSFVLEVERTKEEIDLVAHVGSTILVGEVKCSVLPTEPIEVYRYFDDRVHAGAVQASRKAEFVKNNLTAFISTTNFTDIVEEDVEIVPVVLTNLALGVGMSFGGVPVVDLLILQRFIEEGVVLHNGYFNQEGEVVAESAERLYAS